MNGNPICQTCSALACGSLQYDSDTNTYYCPVFNIGYVAEDKIEVEANTQEGREE